MMERIDKILNHDLFKEYIEKNNMAEEERSFCHHNVEHFLAVARIAQIRNLECSLNIEKAHIYAAALLHDIGRWKQYEDGTPHEEVSAQLALVILRDCGFDNKETAVIIDAISNHRNAAIKDERSLRGILYQGDKLSRSCYVCPAEGQCSWKGDKKNKVLRY